MKTKLYLTAITAIIILLFNCCKNEPLEPDLSLQKIVSRNELKAIVFFNSTDYYIDKGYPMGFQLALLENYCNYIGVKLTIIIKDSFEEGFKSLLLGESDVLAYDVTPTSLRSTIMSFTIPHSKSKLVLIQRKDFINNQNILIPKIKSIKQLDNKKIQLQKHTSYIETVNDLAWKYNIKPLIITDSENSTDNLIEMVSAGEIDYTICEEKIAIPNANLFPNIDFSLQVSDNIPNCWALLKNSDSLRISINKWLNNFLKTTQYKNIYNRYYATLRLTETLQKKKQYISKRQISIYDKYIKKASRIYKWDWRLYAALIYQESGFKDNYIGNGGSFGLLQLMPVTAGNYGVTPSSSPEIQIMRGARYIKLLESLFSAEVKDKEQLSKFVIASYNAGHSHVIDARALTKKYGKNQNIWDNNVEIFLRLKSKPKYFRDPICNSGYYRGAITTNYVNEVWDVYKHYKNFTK